MHPPEYDLAIVGAGASGLIAAEFALQLGAKTALLEKDRIGGDCTWTGCVPSKSLLKAASVAHAARTAASYGIHPAAAQVDMRQVRAYLRGTIEHIYQPTRPEVLRQRGLDVFLGAARFLDPHTLEAGPQQHVRARKILINIGARPRIPALRGVDTVTFTTYLQIFDLDRLPETMLIIGGGPMGCEMAQAYRRLGAEVVLIAEQLLPREEPEVSTIIEDVFAIEGVRRMAARAERLYMDGAKIGVESKAGSASGDLLLLATGRAPVVQELGLEAAGVRYSEGGIEVNRHLQTSARHIYAAGDVIGGAQYSHLAGWQGFQAVRNALLPGKNAGQTEAMPRVTFTVPEVAQIGFTELGARQQYRAADLQVMSFDLGQVDRAVNEDDRRGLLKIIARRNGAILGATIVGERAGEAITEIALAMRNHLKLSDLAATVHPYPTYSTGVQLLATKMAYARAFSGTSGKILRTLSRLWR